MSRPLPPVPDARPHAGADGLLGGWRCSSCGHAVALEAPWCPADRGKLVPSEFGPGGTVWSSTVFRVPLDGRVPPWTLAYVDLDDDGPRVLAHVPSSDTRLIVGQRVRLDGESTEGDILVVAEEQP
jgi:uncharacterized OB-fold protein